MEIVLVGLNHRTAPVEVREKVSFTADQARRAADELRSRGILDETLVLSTCNRSEVYGVPPETSHNCLSGLASFLSEFHSVGPDILTSSSITITIATLSSICSGCPPGSTPCF